MNTEKHPKNEAIKTALPLVYKLVNTIFSKQLEKDLNKNWNRSKESANVKAIQTKSQISLKKGIDRLIKYSENDVKKNLESYLFWFQNKMGIKILASEKKGLINSLEIKDYISITELIYASASCESHNEIGSHIPVSQFEIHQILHNITEYMVIKSTIENGTKNAVFDKTASSLIANKPVQFFENGILSDFFVVDQECAFKDPVKNNEIACKVEYLSTWILSETNNEISNREISNREIYKIA